MAGLLNWLNVGEVSAGEITTSLNTFMTMVYPRTSFPIRNNIYFWGARVPEKQLFFFI